MDPKEGGKSSYYRPLTLVSFLLEKKIWGLEGFNLRFINFLIYFMAMIALFYLFRAQGISQSFPYLGTTLYAFLPVNLDNIVWIVARCDLFLLLWGLLALLSLELYIKNNKTFYLYLSSLFFLAGIFSKESILFFFPVLVIYDFLKRKKVCYWYHLVNTGSIILFFSVKSFFFSSSFSKLTFHSNLFTNLKMIISAMGYYLKSMISIIIPSSYIPVNNMVTNANIILGVLLLVVIGIMVVLAIKNKVLFIPLYIFLIPFFGHLAMVFFSLDIYRASSRFLLVPMIGCVWYVIYFFVRIKSRVSNIVFFAVILLFISGLIINSSNYENEIIYWQRILKAYPQNSNSILSCAVALRDDNRPIESLAVLKTSLKDNYSDHTFIKISFFYDEIESARGYYDHALKWLNGLKKYATLRVKKKLDVRIAYINLCLGKVDEVEKFLTEMTGRYEDKQYFKLLYELYIGHGLWEKAIKLESSIKEKLPGFSSLNTSALRDIVNKSSIRRQIQFYVKYRNYGKVIELLKQTPQSPDRDLALTKYYFLSGRKSGAKLIIDQYLRQGDNVPVLNTFARFFLNTIAIKEYAIAFLKRSLELNNNQPEVNRLLTYLHNL
jgi:hypothetical protein